MNDHEVQPADEKPANKKKVTLPGGSVLSPRVHQARAQAPGAKEPAADVEMLEAVVSKVVELWRFSPHLKIAGGMVGRDGNIRGPDIDVDSVLESCVSHWAHDPEEERLTEKELKAKLKASIADFPTAVLLVWPNASRCSLSRSPSTAFPVRRIRPP